MIFVDFPIHCKYIQAVDNFIRPVDSRHVQLSNSTILHVIHHHCKDVHKLVTNNYMYMYMYLELSAVHIITVCYNNYDTALLTEEHSSQFEV